MEDQEGTAAGEAVKSADTRRDILEVGRVYQSGIEAALWSLLKGHFGVLVLHLLT